MTQVLYAQSAQTDLLEAWLFIAEENMSAADRTIETIEHEAATLSLQPKMGRTRHDLGKDCVAGQLQHPMFCFIK
jgi:toxin ParE1/3/4